MSGQVERQLKISCQTAGFMRTSLESPRLPRGTSTPPLSLTLAFLFFIISLCRCSLLVAVALNEGGPRWVPAAVYGQIRLSRGNI